MRTARDWAQRDTTYVFVEHYTESYVREHLSPEAMSSLQVSFILFLDPNGKLKYGRAFDVQKRDIAELPAQLQDWNLLRQLAVSWTDPKDSRSGLLVLDNRVALTVSVPIRRSVGSSDSRGALVMGRFLSAGVLDRLDGITSSSVQVYDLERAAQETHLAEMLELLKEGNSGGTQPLEGTIASYILLRDMFNEPAVLVELQIPRDLYKQGESALSYYVLSLLLSGLVFGLVFLVLLGKLVLARLDRLSSRVIAIGSTKDFSARVESQGSDELGRVASAINLMLDELETAQNHVAQSRDELELRVEERTAELKRTQQQIIEQERMRALGQMASGIAHDFNNALATILGACELLMMMKQEDEPQANSRDKEFLESIHTAARDAANAVSRLREFYRVREEDEVIHRVDVARLAKQVMTMTEPMWKDQAQARGVSINFKTDLPENSPQLLANEPELRELLTNLIFNSVDAMPTGGTITIGMELEDEDIVLFVRDTGRGMTEEVRQRCLEPFFTTKGDNGTGLGLAMVHGIVRRHEGTLDIESSEGQGATVRIRLPLRRSSVNLQVEEEDAEPVPPQTILLVDDVPSVRRMISLYLIQDGHTVVQADNGVTGIQAFREGCFDLVITDRGMPEMSGDQLAVEIRDAAPHIPIIMLTGFGEMMRSAGEQPPGVDLVVSKPVTVPTLRRAMDQMLQLHNDQVN